MFVFMIVVKYANIKKNPIKLLLLSFVQMLHGKMSEPPGDFSAFEHLYQCPVAQSRGRNFQ
jgi:hypothetical protein